MSLRHDDPSPERWPPVLTVEEVARILRVSTKTVLRYAAGGILPRLPVVGRCLISAAVLREFIEAGKSSGPRP